MHKPIIVLFGTESGNAEFAAEDMAAQVKDRSAQVIDMTDFDTESISRKNFYVIICSTHGEGELPSGAVPMFESLESLSPNLDGVEYAIFGLGDSSYENYSQGSEHIDRKLTFLGATRVGEYGRHDADTGTLPNNMAVAWIKGILGIS